MKVKSRVAVKNAKAWLTTKDGLLYLRQGGTEAEVLGSVYTGSHHYSLTLSSGVPEELALIEQLEALPRGRRSARIIELMKLANSGKTATRVAPSPTHTNTPDTSSEALSKMRGGYNDDD